MFKIGKRRSFLLIPWKETKDYKFYEVKLEEEVVSHLSREDRIKVTNFMESNWKKEYFLSCLVKSN